MVTLCAYSSSFPPGKPSFPWVSGVVTQWARRFLVTVVGVGQQEPRVKGQVEIVWLGNLWLYLNAEQAGRGDSLREQGTDNWDEEKMGG